MNEARARLREAAITFVSLLGSTGTLVCCALPILLVTLGLGSAVVGLTSAFPWLITLSQHKAWVFAASGGMLALSGWLIYRSGRQCPADPALAAMCARADRWNRRVLILAAGIWLLGFFAAYLLLPLTRLFELGG